MKNRAGRISASENIFPERCTVGIYTKPAVLLPVALYLKKLVPTPKSVIDEGYGSCSSPNQASLKKNYRETFTPKQFSNISVSCFDVSASQVEAIFRPPNLPTEVWALPDFEDCPMPIFRRIFQFCA